MKRLAILIALILAVTNLYSQNLKENSNSGIKLEVIGSASASNLYLTYLTIGVIADSYTKKVYDNSRTISFVRATLAQAAVQKKFLTKLANSGEITGKDLSVVKKMIDSYDILLDEGNYFIDYINTKSKNSLKSYDAKRKEAWELISDILGIGR